MSASPRKVTKAPLRKRRKLDLDKVHKNDQHSYVLKLYDRSVDLAKFKPSTPLYPVCRAWIKNKPNSNNLPKRFWKRFKQLYKKIYYLKLILSTFETTVFCPQKRWKKKCHLLN